jgi:pimeloyl-ACP methyl ester carboxylesterase
MLAVNEQFAQLGDVELCFETFGDRSGRPLLLVMGLGTQMIGWPDDFCRELAGRGFHVIRYDNRDSGRSTHFKDVPPPGPLELATRRFKKLAYTLGDMADDGLRLLDHLGIGRAHVAGASMGGMIAQTMAARHPERVLSLASIMSMTGSRRSGNPALRVYPFFLGRPPRGKDAYVERAVKVFSIVGSTGFDRDEPELRRIAALSYDRDPTSSGTPRQLAAILDAGNRTREISAIKAPTVVIHGTKDKMIARSGGKATARAIDGSRLVLIDGMGHDLPRGVWPRIIDAIADNAARAESEVPAWQAAS